MQKATPQVVEYRGYIRLTFFGNTISNLPKIASLWEVIDSFVLLYGTMA